MKKSTQKKQHNPLILKGLTVALLLAGASFSTAGVWTPIKNSAKFMNPPTDCILYKNVNCSPTNSFGGVLQVNLLTDGRLLVEALVVQNGNLYSWREYTFTPDKFGNYINGTWKQVASIPNAYSITNLTGWGPQDLTSAVLPDGRVLYEGGLQNGYDEGIFGIFFDSYDRRGAIYNPVTNKWTSVAPPSFFSNSWVNARAPRIIPLGGPRLSTKAPSDTQSFKIPVGGAHGAMLPNGTYMMADPLSKDQALFNAKTLTWTRTGSGKADLNTGEEWTLLPNGKLFNLDTNFDYYFGLSKLKPPTLAKAELYNPATGSWSLTGGTTPAQVTYFPLSFAGTQSLMPNGKVWVTGSGPGTAVYNSLNNTWAKGPSFPTVLFNRSTVPLAAVETTTVVLPNGNVLVGANGTSPAGSALAFATPFPPVVFFEFDGTKLIREPNVYDTPLSNLAALILLPTGQAMYFDFQTDVEIYTPSSMVDSKNPNYAPTITSRPTTMSPGGTYTLRGTLLNGVSLTNESFNKTNYPLIRIRNNATGHVFYSRTFNFSSMAVGTATGPRPVTSTQFQLPTNQELGASTLVVVANGKPSLPVSVNIVK